MVEDMLMKICRVRLLELGDSDNEYAVALSEDGLIVAIMVSLDEYFSLFPFLFLLFPLLQEFLACQLAV